MKYCVYCSNQLNDNDNFCAKCGKKQPDLDKQPAPAKQSAPARQPDPAKQPAPARQPKPTRQTGEAQERNPLPIIIISVSIAILAVIASVVIIIIRLRNETDINEPETVASETLDDEQTGIMLNWARKTISDGENFLLKAHALPSGNEITDVKWQSTDETVASVSDGVVTAKREGITDIFVTDSFGNSTRCRITVGTEKPETVSDFGDMNDRVVSVTGTEPNSSSMIVSNGYVMNSGCILTTSNVADSDENLYVTMPDGSNEAARLVSNDVENNVCVLRIVDHIDLDGGDEEISSEIGFTKGEGAIEGDHLYVLGRKDAYSSELQSFEVVLREIIDLDGNPVYCVDSWGQYIIGGIVSDIAGNVYGINMLDVPDAELSLILPAAEVEKAVNDQISRYNNKEDSTEKVQPGSRNNWYLDIISDHFGWDPADLSWQYEPEPPKDAIPAQTSDVTGEAAANEEAAAETTAETTAEVTTPVPETARIKAARGYLEYLQSIKPDYDEITSMTGNAPIFVFYDINGDEIPEMIFSRLEEESGTASTMGVSSFDYNRVISYQLVTYDAENDTMTPLVKKYNIVVNNSNEYLQTYGGRCSFYVFIDDPHVYVTEAGNISGAASSISEYSFSANGSELVANVRTTNWGESYDVLSGIPGTNLNRMMASGRIDTIEDCRLLYDHAGLTDYLGYSYEEAVDYLNVVINGN